MEHLPLLKEFAAGWLSVVITALFILGTSRVANRLSSLKIKSIWIFLAVRMLNTIFYLTCFPFIFMEASKLSKENTYSYFVRSLEITKDTNSFAMRSFTLMLKEILIRRHGYTWAELRQKEKEYKHD
jgi:hypothetical protein